MFTIDLGAWSVKLAIASPGLRGATLLEVVERPVPPGDEPAEVRAKEVLASMIQELRITGEQGYIGVYGDQVFTQVLEFGFKNLRRSELDKAVGGELEGVVPVDLEDMVYTFEPLPPPLPVAPAAGEARGRVAPPPEGMRVLTYAMQRDRAEDLIQLGKQCGYDARGVLACGGAAVRLVERTPSLVRARAEGAVAVIDIGHERTDIVVVASGKAVFSRSIARAGRQVTEAIARHWGLPWEKAEQAKHSDGFVASYAEPATSPDWAKIHQQTIGELQPFARDLRQTLAACRARTGFTAIAALLVGGGSRLRGMASFLTEQLGIPAWRPTAEDAAALAGPRLAGDAGRLPIDSAAMAIGMAYDAAGGRPQFDLRSGALSVKMDLSFLRAKAVPLGAAVLAIAASAAGSAYADLYRLRKAEKVLATRLAQDSAEHFGQPKTADAVLLSPSATSGAVVSPMPAMSAYDVLLEISAKVPAKEKITLDIERLDITDQKVDLEGTVKSAEELDLLNTELKAIKCFKDVTRGQTTTGENGIKKFKFTITSECMR
ncbi:MAG: pilus assembly protein PilM [Kofleriaceae bacterium]